MGLPFALTFVAAGYLRRMEELEDAELALPHTNRVRHARKHDRERRIGENWTYLAAQFIGIHVSLCYDDAYSKVRKVFP